MLNGVNVKMVARITGQTPRQGATTGTRTFDLVKRIRARRFKWIGEILWMEKDEKGEERMLRKTVRVIFDNRQEGYLLMDVPVDMEWEELVAWTRDLGAWKDKYSVIRSSNVSKWKWFSDRLIAQKKFSTGVYTGR